MTKRTGTHSFFSEQFVYPKEKKSDMVWLCLFLQMFKISKSPKFFRPSFRSEPVRDIIVKDVDVIVLKVPIKKFQLF